MFCFFQCRDSVDSKPPAGRGFLGFSLPRLTARGKNVAPASRRWFSRSRTTFPNRCFPFHHRLLSQRAGCRGASIGCLLLSLFTVGCGSAYWVKNGFLDPTQVGQFSEPRRNEIRHTLSILEEPEGIQNVEEPTAEDLIADYDAMEIGAGDILEISIYELLMPGMGYTQQVRASTSGFETIPLVGPVRIVGFTSRELELELKQRLREAEVLEDADVRVSVLQSRVAQFSIVGSVTRPGMYPLPAPDYRLLDAIAAAGGMPPVIQKVYVFQRLKHENAWEDTPMDEPARAPSWLSDRAAPYTMSDVSAGAAGMGNPRGRKSHSATGVSKSDTPDVMLARGSQGGHVLDGPEPVWDEQLGQWVIRNPETRPADRIETEGVKGASTVPAEPELMGDSAQRLRGANASESAPAELDVLERMPTQDQPAGEPEWDAELGQWVIRDQETQPASSGVWDAEEQTIQPPTQFPEETLSAPVVDEEWATREAEQAWEISEELRPPIRIIEIPVKELMDGDPRYNIVIRPQDLINVPPGSVGEFFMMGNIARPGAYSLTGRRLTVKEAIASAGGFGPLAWPSRADLVRRVSQDEEQIIQLDLDAIFAGEEPDFYLKPSDIINVGTTPASVFFAVLRNAFRFTYGMGFVYDRNFGDSDTFAAREQVKQRRTYEAQQKGIPF